MSACGPRCQNCLVSPAVKLVRVKSGVRRWRCETCLKRTLLESGFIRRSARQAKG
jgi:hypothetical protein